MEARAFEHDVAEVLADVVDVTFDSTHDKGADGLDARLGEQGPEAIEGARHRPAGDEHLRDEEVTALEAGADLFQRGDESVEQQRLRCDPHLEAGVGELEDFGGVADKRVVVEQAEQFLFVHAAPSLRGRWPSKRDSAAPSATQAAATSPMREGTRRVMGPDTDNAATTSPPSRYTGEATATRPGSAPRP